MKTKFLDVGDVFAVGYGMKVYKKETDGRFSSDLAVMPSIHLMQETIEKGAREIHQKFPFVEYGSCLSVLEKGYLTTRKAKPETHGLEGEYVVIGTAFTGGGLAGGAGHSPHDTYPSGHEVTAQKLKGGKYDPKGEIIRFYQSGCFTAMNEDVPVISKMQMSFV